MDRTPLALRDVDEFVQQNSVFTVQIDIFLILVKCLVLLLQRFLIFLLKFDILGGLHDVHSWLHALLDGLMAHEVLGSLALKDRVLLDMSRCVV